MLKCNLKGALEMELLEKRFGMVAVDNDYISKDQLQQALRAQIDENIENNSHKLIGSILMELGYLDEEQTNKILLALKRD